MISLPSVVLSGLNMVSDELEKIFMGIDMPEALKNAVRHYLTNRGKLVRPMLALLTTYSLSGNIINAIRPAVAVELVHIASLLQDDIMDGHAVRRGSNTPFHMFGLENTMLASDLIIAKSIEYAIMSDKKIVFELINASIKLSIGQSYEMEYKYMKKATLNDYMKTVSYKTSSLIEAALVVGGYSANADRDTIAKLRKLGNLMGIAYQVRDDIVDYLGLDANNPEEAGAGLNIITILGGKTEEALSILNKYLDESIELVKDIFKANNSEMLQLISFLRLEDKVGK
ncbi:MAG: polyprenyl synthetase family protein [Thermocladium sp.]